MTEPIETQVERVRQHAPFTIPDLAEQTAEQLAGLLKDLKVSRGGVQFPPPLAAGAAVEATIAHVQHLDDDGGSTEIYFVWRGKMWKAFAI
jgi:hypothetical protein